MSDKAANHLERTLAASRSEILSNAVVEQIKEESPTVKKLCLKIENQKFSFKAGQWVDFVIQSMDTVGGFSMCSSPVLLEKSHVLELAVKESSHPPAYWIHNKCKIGDKVLVKAGGDCFWEPYKSKYRRNTLLVAGGIGINPMISILQHIEDTRVRNDANNCLHKTILLYSASTKDELIFKDQLDSLVNNDSVFCNFFVTKDVSAKQLEAENFKGRRINQEDVSDAVKLLGDPTGVNCFICGPPPMIKCIQDYARNCGVPESDIHFEQWW